MSKNGKSTKTLATPEQIPTPAAEIDDNFSDGDDDEIEKKPPATKKKQSNWVLTPAREAALKKGPALRLERAAVKRAAEEAMKSKFEEEKQAKLAKKDAKLKKETGGRVKGARYK